MQTGQEATVRAMTDDGQVLSQAEALASQERWKEAAMLLEEYQTSTTPSVEFLGKLADCRSRARDYDGAITIYRNLCQQQPDEWLWFYCLGFQYQKKSQWAESIKAYSESLRLKPRSIKAALRLGDVCREAERNEEALSAYRQGIQSYQGFSSDYRHNLKTIYAKLCARAARVLLEKPNRNSQETHEADKLLRESAEIDPTDADVWYRMGSMLLEKNRLDEALECFEKAAKQNPNKEYIFHGTAKAYLKMNDPVMALKAYERIPQHKRTLYILDGIGQCYLAKEEFMEAARICHEAVIKEPKKFYHQWRFALALIELGAKEQAIEALEKANELFQKERGEEYRKALTKLEEVRSSLPSGKKISFEKSSTNIAEIRYGIVSKYNETRGFGFIEDENGGAQTFFHITKVKKRTPPRVGHKVKYAREVGEKGLQAVNVWLLNSQERISPKGEPVK